MKSSRANLRLSTMTNGRYTLVRRTEKEKGLKASGLGIRYFDAYTGKAGHVNTLSGGELSVRPSAWRLAFPTPLKKMPAVFGLTPLFIGEASGSLDAQSLDAAIECILSLRGKRAYRRHYFSCKKNSKERIPAQLD